MNLYLVTFVKQAEVKVGQIATVAYSKKSHAWPFGLRIDARNFAARASFGLVPQRDFAMNIAHSLTPRTDQRAPLRIASVGSSGRGVIAAADISADSLVERSPVLIIPSDQRPLVDQSIIFTYVFMWEHDTVEEDLYAHHGRAAIALGFTSLLNHSYAPNCRFLRHIDDLVIDLIALQDIRAGDELTIDYQMTLWFTPA